MHDVLPRFDLALHGSPELDEARKLRRLDALLDRRIERAAEGDVDGSLGELDALRPDERGNVSEAHRAHAAVLHLRPGVEAARGNVHDDVVLSFAPLDDSSLESPGDERDGPVAAGGREARVVEEDDAEVGAVVVGLDDEAAVHVSVPARFVHEQAPYVVEPVERVAALVEDRRPPRCLDAARHDPERLPAGVVVGCADLHRASDSYLPLKSAGRLSRNACTPSPKSSVCVAACWSSASSWSCLSSDAE